MDNWIVCAAIAQFSPRQSHFKSVDWTEMAYIIICEERQLSMEDNLDGRNLSWKATFDRTKPLLKYTIEKRTTFDIWQPSMEEEIKPSKEKYLQ